MSTPSPPVPQTPGFLRVIRAETQNALQTAFSYLYPEQDTAGGTKPPYISLAYPTDRAQYPGVWADFEVSLLQTVGLDHVETDASGNILTRWRFQGYSSFTVVALNSNETDMIWDQLVAMTAFAAQSDYPSAFRQAVESNPLVSTTWAYDTIDARGNAAAPGTPWGTDEIVYERGLALKVIGEFVTSPLTQVLVPLREIVVVAQPEQGSALEGNPWTLTIT